MGDPLLPRARLEKGRSAARTGAIRPRARRAACAVVGAVTRVRVILSGLGLGLGLELG